MRKPPRGEVIAVRADSCPSITVAPALYIFISQQRVQRQEMPTFWTRKRVPNGHERCCCCACSWGCCYGGAENAGHEKAKQKTSSDAFLTFIFLFGYICKCFFWSVVYYSTRY